jgi:glutamine amidotransferase-like uncharacterized protein
MSRSFTIAILCTLIIPSTVFAQTPRARGAGKKPAATAAKQKSPRPTALIYNGPGSCEDENLEKKDEEIQGAITDCSASAAMIARKAGFKVKFVGPDAVTDKSTPEQVAALFGQGRVWIQPGGISNEAYNTMSDALTRGLKRFVRAGGGYIGFCAGAFMATELIGGTGAEGLGIVPGSTYTYHKGIALEKVEWLGKKREIYFEGGPYFYNFASPTVEITATYASGAAAAIRTTFGKGRVWVTGLHPEAPLRWTQEEEMEDPDGTEQSLAADMVRWSASKAPVKIIPFHL